MQIKIEAMKNQKVTKAAGRRDIWRDVNKRKTLARRGQRNAKKWKQKVAHVA